MKRKVQAQRKFAQGAYIPPSCNERRSDIATTKDTAHIIEKPNKNVISSNMSASNLLDLVSMKNLVPEMVPVVLVERLPVNVKKRFPITNFCKEIKEPHGLPLNTRGRAPPTIRMPSTVRVPSTVKVPSTVAVPPTVRVPPALLTRKRIISGSLRQLRSRTIVKKMPCAMNKRVLFTNKILKKRVPLFKRTIPLNKKQCARSQSPITSEFSTDDDTPLNLISQKRQNQQIPGIYKKLCTEHTQNNILTPTTPSSHINKVIEKPASPIEPLNKSQLEIDRNELNVNNNVNVIIENEENLQNQPQTINTGTMDTGESYYDTNEIERWVDDITQTQQHTKKSAVPQNNGHTQHKLPLPQNDSSVLQDKSSVVSVSQHIFKVPRPIQIPKRDGRCSAVSIDLTNSRIRSSKCPSESFSTLNDFDTALSDRSVAAMMCRRCLCCNKFRQLKNITKRFRNLLSDISTVSNKNCTHDVYVFDDTDCTQQSLLEFRQNRRKSKDDTPNDVDLQHFYLDLVPNCSRVVQIMLKKDQNQGIPLMHARMVERSEVYQALDGKNDDKIITLMENRDFADQLLAILDLSTSNPPNVSSSRQSIHSILSANEPGPNANKHQPGPSGNKNQSGTSTSEPHLRSSVNGPQPGPSANGPQPGPAANGPQSGSFVSKQQPGTSANEPQSGPSVNRPQPGLSDSAPKKSAKLLEAPVFYPTEAEFENPLKYIDKIEPIASKFGMCKIVAPKGFKPEYVINKSSRFTASNQYPAKMFSRWGSAAKELCAIKTHSATQKVRFVRPPLLDGVEADVINLFHTVQGMGGLSNVIDKELWQEVAGKLGFPKSSLVAKKLDQVYVKYILPYNTLNERERHAILEKVEKAWSNRYKRMLVRARNPLHKQKQLLGESSSDEDVDDEDSELALDEVDDCIVTGRTMTPATFEKVAQTVMQLHFGGLGRDPTPQEVEAEYWRIVVLSNKHVCVNTAAIDTGEQGYGFTKQKSDKYSKHPWNLKVLSNSAGSVLRSLGPVLSVTVPTLHLGMLFSTSCWHRDPHGLPWIEYMHEGPPKIWYGIPDKQSDRFRHAVKQLCPAFCQNKSIWLPSDIIMIPPNLLIDHNVSLSRTVQNPGEFIIIFPKAYSCSICTGYTVSESVYFAPSSWLATVKNDFQEVRKSFEPTMFSLEQLLIGMANDTRVSTSTFSYVYRTLQDIVRDEIENRRTLEVLGVVTENLKHPAKKKTTPWNVRELAECNVCRMTLYLSQVRLLDKKFAYCLQHALLILETPAYYEKELTGITLSCFFTNEALTAIINKLQKQLLPE